MTRPVPVQTLQCPSGQVSYTYPNGFGYTTQCVTQSYADQQGESDCVGFLGVLAVFTIIIVIIGWMSTRY